MVTKNDDQVSKSPSESKRIKSHEEDVTTHQRWIESQGIPIHSEFSIQNLNEVEVGNWERLGIRGAFIVLDAVVDTNIAYILEISPGGSVLPERHLYEEIVYVLSGRGATTVWNEDGSKRTFEWNEGSVFAIPLNAYHQFYNGQGDKTARFYVVSTAPLIMNLFHNLDFVFDNSFTFIDRFDGRTDFFSAEGDALPNRIWKTNFIKDVRTFPLLEWKSRGGKGISRLFELADSTLTCHVSQFPVGTYKKAHRHGAGANVIIIQGKGYSLLWEEGKENEQKRFDWKVGSVLAPPNMWFHQHFNTGTEPAKYLAIRWGSRKYPLFKTHGARAKVDVSVKEGGNQIEYEDEDPEIRKIFEEELARSGVEIRMS
jgi:oxalate decarboxylase/phosphoglucose isomerase-like protein (cupin superfamily)